MLVSLSVTRVSIFDTGKYVPPGHSRLRSDVEVVKVLTRIRLCSCIGGMTGQFRLTNNRGDIVTYSVRMDRQGKNFP